MMRLVIALCAVGIGVGGFAISSQGQEKKEEEKITIKQVMQKAHKAGLLKDLVVKGDATDEQKAELLKLYKGLAAAKPPKGAEDSWKTKTKALVDAAQAAVDGKEGAGQALAKASNCKACHDAHKPPAQ
jgi:hypothetical protein